MAAPPCPCHGLPYPGGLGLRNAGELGLAHNNRVWVRRRHLPAGLCPTSRSAYCRTAWKLLEDEPLLQSSTVLQKPLFKVLVSVTVFGREISKENNPAVLHSFHYCHNLPSKARGKGLLALLRAHLPNTLNDSPYQHSEASSAHCHCPSPGCCSSQSAGMEQLVWLYVQHGLGAGDSGL